MNELEKPFVVKFMNAILDDLDFRFESHHAAETFFRGVQSFQQNPNLEGMIDKSQTKDYFARGMNSAYSIWKMFDEIPEPYFEKENSHGGFEFRRGYDCSRFEKAWTQAQAENAGRRPPSHERVHEVRQVA